MSSISLNKFGENVPVTSIVAISQAAVGFGVGLLLADKLGRTARQRTALALIGAGAATILPFVPGSSAKPLPCPTGAWNAASRASAATPGSPMERKPIRLILASGSPRRKDLLNEAGLTFSIESAQVVELSGIEWTARELCLANAELKAGEVAYRIPDAVVLGPIPSWLWMIASLANPPISTRPAQCSRRSVAASTRFSPEFASCTGKATACAGFSKPPAYSFARWRMSISTTISPPSTPWTRGAYAAQEDNGRLITCIEGLMSNVIGLPIERVLDALTEHFPQTLTPKPQD